MEDFTEPELSYVSDLLLTMQKWEAEKTEGLRKMLKRKGVEFSLENLPEILRVTSYASLREEMPVEYDMEPCRDTKCHNGEIPNLSCFFCNCINYDSRYLQFDFEAGNILAGRCKNSGKGKYHFSSEYPRIGVWDCSDCVYSHTFQGAEKLIRENFEELRARFDKD